jgi:hypothetical protein
MADTFVDRNYVQTELRKSLRTAVGTHLTRLLKATGRYDTEACKAAGCSADMHKCMGKDEDGAPDMEMAEDGKPKKKEWQKPWEVDKVEKAEGHDFEAGTGGRCSHCKELHSAVIHHPGKSVGDFSSFGRGQTKSNGRDGGLMGIGPSYSVKITPNEHQKSEGIEKAAETQISGLGRLKARAAARPLGIAKADPDKVAARTTALDGAAARRLRLVRAGAPGSPKRHQEVAASVRAKGVAERIQGPVKKSAAAAKVAIGMKMPSGPMGRPKMPGMTPATPAAAPADTLAADKRAAGVGFLNSLITRFKGIGKKGWSTPSEHASVAGATRAMGVRMARGEEVEKADKLWDPSKGSYANDAGEKTVGTSTPPHKVTPRISGPGNVAAFKAKMGVCDHPGCFKIAGHGGHGDIEKAGFTPAGPAAAPKVNAVAATKAPPAPKMKTTGAGGAQR